MGEVRGVGEEGQRQEQCVCVEIRDRLAVPASAQPLVACPRENFTPSSPLSIENAIVSVPECRICQEEEDPAQLETPCDCSGTLKVVRTQHLELLHQRHDIPGLGAVGGPRSPLPQLHLAGYPVPPMQKLMMLSQLANREL